MIEFGVMTFLILAGLALVFWGVGQATGHE